MFGKMGDMMGMLSKLKDAQKKLEETKKQLDNEFLEETSENIYVKVSVSGKIDALEIKDSTLPTKELEQQLTQTLNSVLEKAKTQYEQKISQNLLDDMPNLPKF